MEEAVKHEKIVLIMPKRRVTRKGGLGCWS